MTSPKRRRDESRSPASKDAKKAKLEDENGTPEATPPPYPRSTASVSPTKKTGPLAEVQSVFASAEMSSVARDKSVWIMANTEAMFGDLSDEDWKMYADKVAGALALLRKEWLELEDKRRQLTGGRKRRKG
ncbi:hypothetical protein CJU89_4753 [Yarrowia sp. B02]|nr:hypothetical protein CJU89_4753 [Yarrowia sp. B02]